MLTPAQIVDSDIAVIEAGDNKVRVGGADVEGEHPAGGQAGVLGVGRVLQGVNTNHAALCVVLEVI